MPSLDFEEENRVFREWYSENYPALRAAEKAYRNLIHLLLSDVEDLPTAKVLSRLKNRDECVKKFQRKYQSSLERTETPYQIRNHISDLIGIRVVCLYESNVKPVVGRLKKAFHLIGETDKTKILQRDDDRFGYHGMHLDLKLDNTRSQLEEYKKLKDFEFEVQVRTIVQDAWSEIDHKLKYKKDLPSILKRRVYILAGLFELADREFDAIRSETAKLVSAHLKKGPDGQPIDQPLNPFNFLRLMQAYFPTYNFHSDKIEGFVDDIRAEKPDVTIKEVGTAMENHFERLQEYRDWSLKYLGRNLNPYTQLRHVLYRYNNGNFDGLMFAKAKENFNRWDTDGSVFKGKYE